MWAKLDGFAQCWAGLREIEQVCSKLGSFARSWPSLREASRPCESSQACEVRRACGFGEAWAKLPGLAKVALAGLAMLVVEIYCHGLQRNMRTPSGTLEVLRELPRDWLICVLVVSMRFRTHDLRVVGEQIRTDLGFVV